LKQFLLPDVGEGLTEAEIIKWDVGPGDTVVINQTLVEIETAKAAVELPSPFAGVVTELHAAPGDTVDVGRPIITIDVAPGSATAAASGPPSATIAGEAGRKATIDGEGRQAMLVGYGPRPEGTEGRRRRLAPLPPLDAIPDEAPPPDRPEQPVPAAATPAPVIPATPAAARPAAAVASVLLEEPADIDDQPVQVRAKPPVRMLAKSLGIDLATVTPTGPNGIVSRGDVERAADGTVVPAGPRRAPGVRETRVPIRGVRKHTAAAMVASAFTAPHVTEFLAVDVTETMALRERIAARPEFGDVKVSPMLLLARAVIIAALGTPEINASWDEPAGEIVLKHYVNLGIAAATPRGLIVPNIKDADQLSLRELALALAKLTATARAGTTPPADLAGGTITITNVGVFGVDTGTPILNPGESGIVAFGSVSRRPWVVEDEVVPRWVTQLAISFDHRVVDGQQGSRFLAAVGAILTDPGLALL
jgi:pyruvate dehydrogenase E2 component (dihydrolipoamide acetyltransferase)